MSRMRGSRPYAPNKTRTDAKRPGQPVRRSGTKPLDGSVDDRRQGDRVPFPAELVLVWNHDLATPVRYSILDAGDGGYRLRSSTPMIEGATGMVLRLLPGRGAPIEKPVMVAWTKPLRGGYEIGLRCF